MGGYWLFTGFCMLWVLYDARGRGVPRPRAWRWFLATALLAPITLPLWLAGRPLLPGQRRDGGKGWNRAKAFALTWSLLVACLAVWNLVELATTGQDDQTTRAGTGLAMLLSIIFLGAIWFVVAAGALAIGLFIRQPSVVEVGPPPGRSVAPAPAPGPDRR